MIGEAQNLIDFDAELSEEQKMIRASAREFAQNEVAPFAAKNWQDGEFPFEIIKRMGGLGFLGANLNGYGCSGIDSISYGLLMQELENVDSGLRSFASVQGALCMWPIYHYGTQVQKEKYLPGMAKGELVGAFGLTEPDYGSDPGGMITTAKKVKDGYLINGNKMWITNGCIADVIILWAKLNGTIVAFLVDKDTEGFTTTKIKNKMSLRMSVTSQLHFDNCFVPEGNRLPRAEGLKSALFCLNQARFGIAWGVLGAADAVYGCALEYALTRNAFGKALAQFQLVQAKLVDIASQISIAKLLMLHLAKKKDQHTLKHYQVSLAKMNNCSLALKAARSARDILGASGITEEYPVMRHLLNLETVNTYEGTEDIHRLVLGNILTGKSAFY